MYYVQPQKKLKNLLNWSSQLNHCVYSYCEVYFPLIFKILFKMYVWHWLLQHVAAKFLSVVLRKSSLFCVLKHLNIQVQHWVTWFSFLTIQLKLVIWRMSESKQTNSRRVRKKSSKRNKRILKEWKLKHAATATLMKVG